MGLRIEYIFMTQIMLHDQERLFLKYYRNMKYLTVIASDRALYAMWISHIFMHALPCAKETYVYFAKLTFETNPLGKNEQNHVI